LPSQYVRLADIEQISQLENNVIRNFHITQRYHELSKILAERTDGIFNWCTFATWASKQAGRTIRKEDLGHRLETILGKDLVPPPDLQQLSHPELLALLLKIDPTIDSTLESGAEYWGDLIDRLHFIADFFRCYLMSAELFEPPFLLEQVSVIREGRLPSGRL
jgi:hypothetical protein